MKNIFVFLLVSLVILSPFASAWGIAYAQNNFTVQQGQKQDVHFTLQNYVGDEVKRIIIELGGDKEIATVLDKKDYYLLLPKTKDHQVTIQVAIPEQAKKNYRVNVNFIDYGGGQGISLANAKVISIHINVPDGTLNDTALDEQPQENPADLTVAYEKVEEQIEEEEGNVFDTKIQGLTVLDVKNTTWPILLTAISLLALLIVMASYRKKRRQKKLGLR